MSYVPSPQTSSCEGHDDVNDPLLASYAGAKRRIAALEQQLQNLRDAGAKRKQLVTPLVTLILQLLTALFYGSNQVTNITRGRVICRLVSLFDSVEELIEEDDRRNSEDELDVEHTME
jgi:hypothetical protein